LFTRRLTLLLLPLEHFFHVAVFDDRDALVEIQEPLNNVRH